MIKLVLTVLCLIGFLSKPELAFAKLNLKNAAKLSELCYKRNRNLKNYADICACQKKNFRWLFANKQWEDVERIYRGKVSRSELKKRDGLSAVDFLVVTVEDKCSVNQNYLAPKAKILRKKSKR